ncbi:hypothetical protein D9V41_12550 [Aeromicrobium phragmitis]|uniref:Uncharacterized protein n=1 Tax=Aeromicrobium phragmitis TaxID=2478914 RepID=A0A3L8PIG3_9ACTN|nr:hypothetical protein D9V41_12550 [Aeromicrobium phragmitis]
MSDASGDDPFPVPPGDSASRAAAERISALSRLWSEAEPRRDRFGRSSESRRSDCRRSTARDEVDERREQ